VSKCKPRALHFQKKSPTHLIRGWVGLKADLKNLEKKKFLALLVIASRITYPVM
jgi:hypothetical protein